MAGNMYFTDLRVQYKYTIYKTRVFCEQKTSLKWENITKNTFIKLHTTIFNRYVIYGLFRDDIDKIVTLSNP